MAGRMRQIGVEPDTVEMADQLDDIETSLENSDKDLEPEIVATREELCAERGFQGHELEECDNFMLRACGPSLSSVGKRRREVPQIKCLHFSIARRREAKRTARTEREDPQETDDDGSSSSASTSSGKKETTSRKSRKSRTSSTKKSRRSRSSTRAANNVVASRKVTTIGMSFDQADVESLIKVLGSDWKVSKDITIGKLDLKK